MLRLVIAMVLAMSATAAQGAEPGEFAGTWVMKIGERNLFVLTLTPEGDGMKGRFERPATFSSSNGTFANIRGGVRRDKVVRGRFEAGVLHLTIQNARDPKDEDAYMTLKGGHAELAFDGLPAGVVVQPYVFERGPAAAAVAMDWEPNRLYVPGADSDVSNPAMKAIFDEDQRVRTEEKIDWQRVSRSDAERRQQARNLLADGALHTAKDYEEAAFVFQHGDSPQDYLLAHTLAMVAVSKGDPTAIWIAAATLDRYLEKIGQKQIFGTQTATDAQGHWTQEPYDRELVSDALRQQLGVPPQSIQTEQLKAYQ